MDRNLDRTCPEPDETDLTGPGDSPFEKGVQPLDALMREQGLDNHAVVRLAAGSLTHKMVQKGRTGRRLTAHIQRRILEVLRQATGRALEWDEVFNYRG